MSLGFPPLVGFWLFLETISALVCLSLFLVIWIWSFVSCLRCVVYQCERLYPPMAPWYYERRHGVIHVGSRSACDGDIRQEVTVCAVGRIKCRSGCRIGIG